MGKRAKSGKRSGPVTCPACGQRVRFLVPHNGQACPQQGECHRDRPALLACPREENRIFLGGRCIVGAQMLCPACVDKARLRERLQPRGGAAS
jgi:hypothetical protein